MRAAPHVDDFDSLLDVAHTFNDNCEPPMEEYSVISTAKSAWGYEQRGENRFGKHGAWFPLDELTRMIDNQDAFFLLAFLRANQGPDATFMCANGLADKFGWTRKRLADARLRRLIELGYFKPAIERLLTDVQIALQSALFVGPFKSNVSRFVANVHWDPARCVSADERIPD